MSLYWINLDGVRLGIMPRPRGNDWLSDDLRLLRQVGVDVVVSALTSEENQELGLTEEGQECANIGLVFVSFPIKDRSVPASHTKFGALVDRLSEYLGKGKAIAVHCRAGIGRSSMIAASVLNRNSISVDSAFQAIAESRGCAVPDTLEQRQWVEQFSLSSKL